MSSGDRRAHYVERLKQRLTQRGNPYTEMFLILSLTGLAGFLASVWLRWMGLAHYMGLRYLLSVMVAYAVFLALLGIWLAINRPRRRAAELPAAPAIDGNDVANAADALLYAGPDLLPGPGGMLPDIDAPVSDGPSVGGSLKGLGSIGDVKDGEGLLLLVVLLIVVALLAALFASVWILFEAPVLLAELLVDGALIAGLAKRLRRRDDEHHWAVTALRRTYVPFLITAAAFAFVGFSLQYFVPEATTMLEALHIAAQ
jgi:hypothetical protein